MTRWRALSLWQPWASLIAQGIKTFETRSWGTEYRGPILVHAAKRWTSAERKAWVDMAEDFEGRFPRLEGRALPPLGVVVAAAELADCFRFRSDEQQLDRVPANDHLTGDTSCGRWGWRLEHVRALACPVALRGMQGLWVPEDFVRIQVEAQLGSRP